MSSPERITESPYNIDSIADVDAAIEDILKCGLFKELVQWDLTPFEQPFLARSPSLRRFLAMRHLHRQSADVAQEYRAQDQYNRALFRADPDACSPRHLQGFKFAFGQIDARSGGAFSGGRVRRFADVGCAPGGFAEYVLQGNQNAMGTGLTLSPGAGGLRMQLDSSLLGRFDVRYGDVRDFAMGRETLENSPGEGFDLVAAHAAIMFADGAVPWAGSFGLVYAQILFAFQHLALGGALVTSFRVRPLDWIVDIVRLLLRAFDDVRAFNPTYQARRPFAYIICRGFRMAEAGNDREECLCRLRACVEYLEGDGGTEPVEDGVMNIPRLCGDIPDEACTDFLGLFDGVWESKYTAIRSNFEKVLSKRVKGYNTSSEEKAIHDGIGEGDSNPTTKYRPPRVGRWTKPMAQFDERVPWRGRTTAEPDSYQARREQKNAGLDALFSRGGGAGGGGGADRAVSWRR